GGGLLAQGGELKGFELANAYGEYVPATATIEKNTVRLVSTEAADPAAWRYAWGGNPEATLHNREGLPATPYRYAQRGKVFQRDRGQFSIPNPVFAEVNDKGEPTYWQLKPETALSREKTFRGDSTLLFREVGKSGVVMNSIASGAGYFWNAPTSSA
ncbi:MAG: hypothetical protein HQL31_09620, partial [Planctomycetes bacterium]|nr:hypothetical protein [Planctomycetota bacterium]